MGTARRRIQRRQRAHRDHLATIAPRPKSTTTSTNAPECLPHPSPGRDWTIGFAIVDGVDEWDIYQTDEVAAWLRELQGSDPKTASLVDDAIYTLSVSGPALGRPLVDTIANSKIANLKEFRARFPWAQRGPRPVRIRPVALGDPARRRR
jgi:hypothetical protein